MGGGPATSDCLGHRLCSGLCRRKIEKPWQGYSVIDHREHEYAKDDSGCTLQPQSKPTRPIDRDHETARYDHSAVNDTVSGTTQDRDHDGQRQGKNRCSIPDTARPAVDARILILPRIIVAIQYSV
jgi:hypothetical protein